MIELQLNQGRSVGIWRLGQEVNLAPLVMIFSQKVFKMVDSKKFSVIFKRKYTHFFKKELLILNFSLISDPGSLTNMYQMVGLLFFLSGRFQPPPPSGARGTCPPSYATAEPKI